MEDWQAVREHRSTLSAKQIDACLARAYAILLRLVAEAEATAANEPTAPPQEPAAASEAAE